MSAAEGVAPSVDMAGRRKASKSVTKAFGSTSLVRIETAPRKAESVDGFVVGVGAKWVLVAPVGSGGFLDEGLAAVRRRDIIKVTKDSSFESLFARTRPEWPPAAPATVDLDGTSVLIKSLSRVSPLIGIGQERRYNRPLRWIGVVDDIREGWLWLQEVRPDATWHKRPLGYKLSRITKVTISDRYLTALAVIAGDHPAR